MGLILDSTPEMGEYSVEVRRESFHLSGGKEPHTICVYPNYHLDVALLEGTCEILIEDIPKIRAALDLVEKAVREDWRGSKR
jgi:hypothetical protein